MKNVLKSMLFTALLLVPAAVFAQGSGSAESYPSTSPRGTAEERGFGDSNFVVTRSESGTIVGLKEGVLTIKTKKNKEIRVGLIDKTKYKIGKKSIDNNELELSMFEEGREIKITYVPINDQRNRIDKVAVEVRLSDDKDKKKPVLGDG